MKRVFKEQHNEATPKLGSSTTKANNGFIGKLFTAGAVAIFATAGALGVTALAKEKPKEPVLIADVGSVAKETPTSTSGKAEKETLASSKEAPTDKKVAGAGEKKGLSGYTLSVNTTNCFVGDPIVVSILNARGELVKGETVDVTDPDGKTSRISMDNLVNGFKASLPGIYTLKYGDTKIEVSVREMDAELAKLDGVPLNEVKSLVEKTEHLFSYTINGNDLVISNAQGKHLVTTNISRLKELKLSLDGMPLEYLRIGSETGKNSAYGGEYLQILIVATSAEGDIGRNMLMQTLVIGIDSKQAYGPEVYLLK